MKTSEKVAYIKGLMEGMALDTTKNENKILDKMVEVLEELATANNALTEENIKLRDYIEEIDSDLGDLEEYVYESDDCDCDCDCDCCDCYDDEDDDEYEFEDYSEDEEESEE